MSPGEPASASPHCPAHQRAAVATCTRCGTFLCGECTELLGEAAYCASCVGFLREHAPAYRALWTMLCLEVAGLLFVPQFVFLGWFRPVSFLIGRMLVPLLNLLVFGLGLWLSGRELRRITERETSLEGRTLAQWVRRLAWVNLFCFLFLFLFT